MARLGSIYQRFFESCEDAGTTVAITDGWVEEVRPDGTGKLIADISAAVAEEERRRLIKRVEAGVERAQDQGKWLGAVPKGFERVDDGKSYRAVARSLPNLTRPTLMNIHKNSDRRRWYLGMEADDERVDGALEAIR